jgi:alkylation response protein AidB-like acyl-CoA dehydrogenase
VFYSPAVDLEDTPSEARFRAEARAFLGSHARLRQGKGDRSRIRVGPEGIAGDAHVRRCKEWQRTLYDGGWAGITWPAEHGGRGGTAMEQVIFNQEQARYDVSTGVFAVAIGMTGPTLIAHGTPEQKTRYLPSMLRGDEVWCQLFSEPGAGSDLAGLSTKAELDGEEWVVSGQKVWTSGAQHSDFAILLARTDPDRPKHRGLTYFLLPMSTPGIEVRPLTQINGVAHFSEVFLTDVRVPASNVVGEVGGGWGVALTTLANERAMIGGGDGGASFADLATLAHGQDRLGDPLVRQGLAGAFTRYEILRYLGFRVQTALSQGRSLGPEGSIMKLLYSRHMALTADLALAILGPAASLIGDGAAEGGFWQQYFLGQFAVRIGGGTDEVQRNVVGERVLGLPAEPRPDKAVPFRELAGLRA